MSYKSFVDFLLKKQDIDPPDAYKRIGWNRQRYHDLINGRWNLKCEDLHQIRCSVGMSRTRFWRYLQKFFDPKR